MVNNIDPGPMPDYRTRKAPDANVADLMVDIIPKFEAQLNASKKIAAAVANDPALDAALTLVFGVKAPAITVK